MTQVRLSNILIPAHIPMWQMMRSHQYLRYVAKGGRGSGKSTLFALFIVYEMMRYPISTLCVRKVGLTLKRSVYEELRKAINLLGVSPYWRAVGSPLRLIYLPRGNEIIFSGADDSEKIKGITDSKFALCLLWLEELAEFRTKKEVQDIENSILRAKLPDGLNYTILQSYNPPKRRHNWVNKIYETQFMDHNTYINHSTYLDNPYISSAFVGVADNAKANNPKEYDHIYLGKPIGSGIVPFDNLIFRGISSSEISTYDNIRQGCDWGYGVDPVAHVRWHYDKTRRKLYAIDEIYGVKMSNRMLAEQIKTRGYQAEMTIADSAEPKSIAELDDLGIKIRRARKGAGSVEYGEKWLDDLAEIVIDPKRTPNIAREFEGIDYQTDKDGNPLSRLEDKDNHTIDATRYALEQDMSRSGAKITLLREGL